MPLSFLIVLCGGLVIVIAVTVFKHARSRRARKGVTAHVTAGKDLEAIKNLKRIVKEQPDDIQSQFELATLEIKAGMFLEGAQLAKKLLERNLQGSGIPQVKVLLLLADAELAQGNRADAYRNLTIVRGLDATNTDVNIRLAILEYDNGNFKDSYAYATRVCKLEPFHVEGNYYRGMAAFQLGSFDAAQDALRRTLEADAGHYLAALTLARVAVRMGNTGEVPTWFQMAVKNAKTPEQQAQAWYHWALHHRASVNYKKALAALANARQTAQGGDLRKAILKETAELHEEGKEIPDFLAAAREYLKLDPGHEGFRNRVAYYQELHGNDKLRTYEISQLADFTDLCRRLAMAIASFDTVQGIDTNKDGTVDVLCTRSTKTHNIVYQFRFARGGTPVSDILVRDLYAKMKSNAGEKGILVCNSTFTEGAVNFAQTRTMSLLDKTQLLSWLEKV